MDTLLSDCKQHRRTHLQHSSRCGCLDCASASIWISPIWRWSHANRVPRMIVCMDPFGCDSAPDPVWHSNLYPWLAQNALLRHSTVTDVPTIVLTWRRAKREQVVLAADRDFRATPTILLLISTMTMMNHLLRGEKKKNKKLIWIIIIGARSSRILWYALADCKKSIQGKQLKWYGSFYELCQKWSNALCYC